MYPHLPANPHLLSNTNTPSPSQRSPPSDRFSSVVGVAQPRLYDLSQGRPREGLFCRLWPLRFASGGGLGQEIQSIADGG